MKKFALAASCFFYGLIAFSQVPKVYNSSEILLQMKKLKVLGSVLYIAAHPDDENNSLLPWLANEKLYRTAYLSLTRGDGGQNLIGEEQGIELGIIRTQELIAARKVDGGEQYFTRAYEFGFSKSAEESLSFWDREKVLSDIVWVIRKYHPDIIIKRFPPDSRAGHGHHAASAILADEAYAAASDPERFKEHFKYGVRPWKAKRLLWNSFNFGSNNTTSADQMKIDIGGYNPLLGKSYGEIGGEARTMHKSQGEGRPRRRGQILEYFATTAGEPATNSLMDGVETSWSRIQGGAAIESKIDQLLKEYDPQDPGKSVPLLVNIYKAVKQLPASAWKEKKSADLEQLIEACAGLHAEITTQQTESVQGDSLRVSVTVNKRIDVPVSFTRLRFENIDTSLNIIPGVNVNTGFSKTALIPLDKEISQPYWLKYPLKGSMFDVRDQLMIGEAENKPSLAAIFEFKIAGEDISFTKQVLNKFVDPVKGELYQPVPVLPVVEVNFDKENYSFIYGKWSGQPQLKVQSNLAQAGSYTYRISDGNAWKFENNSGSFTNTPQGIKPIATKVAYAGSKANESSMISGSISREGSEALYSRYRKSIAYDHIPTQTYFPQAKANLIRLDLKTSGRLIGYIPGAGDKIPEALEAMGYQVKVLDADDITEENLRQFDAIITGIRAYNIHEWLSDKNEVFNSYVESGGNMIVQYLKSNTVGTKRVKVGPYKFAVDPSSRVTEENAEVRFTIPSHPALNLPNKITADDFNGWVQERSTYQAVQADSAYEMPISMNDKGSNPSSGSLAIARYGKGNFVYASLVFFRQLPAGNTGAYRLLANLIALPKNKQTP